jgi:hypothetical protein
MVTILGGLPFLQNCSYKWQAKNHLNLDVTNYFLISKMVQIFPKNHKFSFFHISNSPSCKKLLKLKNTIKPDNNIDFSFEPQQYYFLFNICPM